MFKDIVQGASILIASAGMIVVPLSLSPSPSLPPTPSISPSPDDASIPLDEQVITNSPSCDPDSCDDNEGEEIPLSEYAMIHDPANNTFIVYPDSLPLCDNEDGTAISNSLPVSACMWDANGEGRTHIVIAP